MALEVAVRTVDGFTVVACSDKLVLGDDTNALGSRVREILEQNPVIVMDLSGITYADSSGVGTLMGLFIAARARSGEIKFAEASDRLFNVLKTMQLVGVLGMYPKVEDAIRSLKERATAAPGPF